MILINFEGDFDDDYKKDTRVRIWDAMDAAQIVEPTEATITIYSGTTAASEKNHAADAIVTGINDIDLQNKIRGLVLGKS